MDNLQKFRSQHNKIFVGILTFFPIQVFSTCGKGKLVYVRVNCKVLVPIKEVLIKNDYFLYPKSMAFCIGAVFTERNMAHVLVMRSLFS